VGAGKPITLMVEKKLPHSMIFWGPPGTGKTTLASIIANSLDANFVHLSAVSAGKADVKKVIDEAKTLFGQKTILFLDEIHRFNKAQQDFLLPYVENGTITFIGATTENPSFSVISALLSRTQVFVLESHSNEDIGNIIDKALGILKEKAPKKAKDFLISYANGDARQVLNLLENTHSLYKKISLENLKNALQNKYLRYDKGGDEHYNTISAFIKSMRASNVDATVYYLARMIASGEDPLFIARRMVVFASEDVGLAQPTALVVANAVFEACRSIGYPECSINLAHGATYLAQAKKDRSSNDAIKEALSDVERYGNLSIPLNLRNAPTKFMKELGYGKGYEKYTNADLLPKELAGKKYIK
jgi:putative ATPase